MKYRLNRLEPKTTNHFNINDCPVDLDIPSYKLNGIISLPKDNNLYIKEKKVKESITSKIGIDYKEYYSIDLTIKENSVVDDIKYIDIDLKKDDHFISKINFNIEENSISNFVIRIKDELLSTLSLMININGCNNSNFNLTIINNLNNKSNSFIELNGNSFKDTNIITNIIDYGGTNRIYRYNGILEKENSKSTLNTLYISGKDELMDMNYYLTNKGISSNSKITVIGALNDNSRKLFRGTIDFLSGSTNSIGEENEECILLSDNCISRSLPEMLCAEENVSGTHGVSSGKVSEEKLFYLMSRGYSRRKAEMLIVLGSFKKVLRDIPNEELIEEIFNSFEDKLS